MTSQRFTPGHPNNESESPMNTETIKAQDLRDGDEQVSEGAEQTRVIRNPRLVNGMVNFDIDGDTSFRTLEIDSDVTIRARTS